MSHEFEARKASTRRMNLRVIRTVMALVIITMCAACDGTPQSMGGPDSKSAGGRLVWGKPAEADVIDPTVSNAAPTWELLHLSYENLVGLDDNLRLVPELATSWRQTSPTTYVFTLRKGVRFANGRAMTVDDVVGSLDRLIDPKVASAWAGQLGRIRKVAAVGDSEVEVTLAGPRTSFLAALAGNPAVVLPMKELKEGGFDPRKQLLGTGPFRLVGHSQGESWTFERNPYYWRPGLPKAGRLTVRIIPDDAARVAALRDGSIDVTTFENPDSIRLLKGLSNVKTVAQATTDYYRLDVNSESSIFRDERLRQALALSIDREKIRNVALGGVGRPTAAVSAAYGVCAPAKAPFATPDLTRARQLVAAAGATGKTVEIVTSPVIPMSSPIAQVIQQNLRSVGLQVRLVSVEIGQLFKRAYSGKTADFDLIVSWFSGHADPAMTSVAWNPDLTGWDKPWVRPDAPLNKLIDRSLSTGPGAERTGILQSVCDHIARDANIIPLVTKDAIVAYRPDKVSPRIFRVEGYAVPLRRLADFGVK